MTLIDVYAVRPEITAIALLYALFLERPRETWISTTEIPTTDEHSAFVASRPYRAWYLLWTERDDFVGSIYLGHDNSIGVAVLRAFQKKGYGSMAIELLMEKHEPLPGLPSCRSKHFVANIAIGNDASERLFAKLGFQTIQTVMAKK